MSVLSAPERRFLKATASLGYSNPFLPERIEWERAALGREYLESEPVWSVSVADPDADLPNILRIYEKLTHLIDALHSRMAAAADLSPEDLAAYEDSVHSLLYQRYYPAFRDVDARTANARWQFYRQFLADWNRYLVLPGKQFETSLRPAHVFACFHQVQRAFRSIFYNIIGSSMPAARLRASIWQSIFTHDMRRYRRTLYRRMSDFPTLITGPSGTGKELVARAIAGSRYIPFDPERLEFGSPSSTETFFAINVAALSPALIESELFGHRRGSFTGAITDRKGWLETCPPLGTVFLDELGEMELLLQVKLLRAIETRRFSPVGDTAVREFRGKLIAATNRDLRAEIGNHRFREDLYYRLCADLIRTPSLREQIDASAAVLQELTLFMVRRVAGDEAEDCIEEVQQWIGKHMPAGYSWPGNYRELEQCVRNVIIRGAYQPVAGEAGDTLEDGFPADFRAGKLKADEVLAYYAALVYRKTGSYEDAARQLGVDRRTVKARVEAYLGKQFTDLHPRTPPPAAPTALARESVPLTRGPK